MYHLILYICLIINLIEYGVYKTEKGNLILAKDLAEKAFAEMEIAEYELVKESECYNGDSYVDNDGTYFQKKDNMTENEEQKTEENKKEKEE